MRGPRSTSFVRRGVGPPGQPRAQCAPSGPAHRNSPASHECRLAPAATRAAHTPNRVHAHDRRAMYADEKSGVELGGERIERFAMQDGRTDGVEARVIADGFDPLKGGDGDDVGPPDASRDDL